MKGATGRVLVDYVITNTFYTNIFTTNIYGTNLFITNYPSGGYTNTFTTNILVTQRYQNNEYGAMGLSHQLLADHHRRDERHRHPSEPHLHQLLHQHPARLRMR